MSEVKKWAKPKSSKNNEAEQTNPKNIEIKKPVKAVTVKTLNKLPASKHTPKKVAAKATLKPLKTKAKKRTAHKKPIPVTKPIRKRPHKTKISSRDNLKLPAPEESEAVTIEVKRRPKEPLTYAKTVAESKNILLATNSPKKRKIGKVIKRSLIVFFILLGGAYYTISNLTAESTGTIMAKPAVVAPTVKATLAFKTYNGKYFNFSYPGNFDQRPYRLSGKLLDVVSLISVDNNTQLLNASVVQENIANESGIAFRRSRPDMYKEAPVADGILFTKTQSGFERTYFLVHDGLVASFSLTDPSSDDFSPILDQLITTLTWK